MRLPDLLSVEEIHERLRKIFPEGSPQRNYCVREIAAKTVFVMLYVGATEDEDTWIRPDQVTRMTDEQAGKQTRSQREAWTTESLEPSRSAIPGRWYAQNTREPIRDETIREGLIPVGAVVERGGLPVTSPRPRYALSTDFAALFDPNLQDSELNDRMSVWRTQHLSSGALARVQLLRQHVADTDEGVMVRFPNGETRRMSAGPSSLISREVIERFALRFLTRPGVLFLSESRRKVVARDVQLARAVGLDIRSDENLPDIILVDLESERPLLVFVEVVATAGPVSERRKKALLEITEEAGFESQDVAFVTAYKDRSHRAFKSSVQSLAWESFVWFASEPNNLVYFSGDEKHEAPLLRSLLRK